MPLHVRISKLATSIFLFGLIIPAHAAPPPKNPDITKIVKEISAKNIEVTIRKLVSFETRNSLSDTTSDTKGIGAARRWIKAELEHCNAANGGRMLVEFDEHRAPVSVRVPRQTPIAHVFAILPGEQAKSRDRIYLVSGHYDSMRGSPLDADGFAPALMVIAADSINKRKH